MRLYFWYHILMTLFPHHIAAISLTHKTPSFLQFHILFMCFALTGALPRLALRAVPRRSRSCLFIFSVTVAIKSNESRGESISLYNLSHRGVHDCIVLMDNKLLLDKCTFVAGNTVIHKVAILTCRRRRRNFIYRAHFL